mgnify:CR=1 FL=1
MKPKLPTEYDECIAFVQYLELKNLLFTHISSEMQGSWGARMRNKRMGVRKGFPDYAICWSGNLLFIEMKRKKSGAISDEQHTWQTFLNTVPGVSAKVCYGADEAIASVENYLNS